MSVARRGIFQAVHGPAPAEKAGRAGPAPADKAGRAGPAPAEKAGRAGPAPAEKAGRAGAAPAAKAGGTGPAPARWTQASTAFGGAGQPPLDCGNAWARWVVSVEIEREVRSLAVSDKCFWKSVNLTCLSVCRSTSFCDVAPTSFRQQVHHIIELA